MPKTVSRINKADVKASMAEPARFNFHSEHPSEQNVDASFKRLSFLLRPVMGDMYSLDSIDDDSFKGVSSFFGVAPVMGIFRVWVSFFLLAVTGVVEDASPLEEKDVSFNELPSCRLEVIGVFDGVYLGIRVAGVSFLLFELTDVGGGE